MFAQVWTIIVNIRAIFVHKTLTERALYDFQCLFNTYSMKQPDLYYFETIKMTSQA